MSYQIYSNFRSNSSASSFHCERILVNVDSVKIGFEFNSERRSDTSELSNVAQKALNPPLHEGVKPKLPQGPIIPLQILNSHEGSINSSCSKEGDDLNDVHHLVRGSSAASMIALKGDDDIQASATANIHEDDVVVVQEKEISSSPDTVTSISPRPGIIAKAFHSIFNNKDKQIVESTVKEISERYGRFTQALNPDQFEEIKISLKDEMFISRIIELKALSGSFKGKMMKKIQSGLELFKHMVKALEFIDVATQRNPSIKLNMAQIQVVQTILKGVADPLYQTYESKELGKGTYGTVAETSPGLPEKRSETSYAIKCCRSLDVRDYAPEHESTILANNEKSMEELQTEYEVLMKFDHPNIIRPIYVHDRVLYMELAEGGSLYKNYHRMAGQQLIKIFIQTADALAHMHERGYVHGDVKGDNIFLTKELDAKVGDLGLCRLQDNFNFDFEGAYAAYYFPPECLTGAINTMDEVVKKQAALKIDSWSFGTMLWQLLNRSHVRSLYKDDKQTMSSEELMRTIKDSFQLEKFTENGCDIGAIMCACLNSDFTARPTMAEVRDMLKRGRV